jgi:hypothetical protein
VIITGALCIAGAIWFSFERPRLDAALQPRRKADAPVEYALPSSRS